MTVGDSVQRFTAAELRESIDNCIALVSQKLTLKTGDLVFIAAPITVSVNCGKHISVKLNESELLNFYTK